MSNEKTCNNCRNLFNDPSVGQQECMNYSCLTEREHDRHFGDNQPGCRYHVMKEG